MTVKELSNVFNVSSETIKNTIRKKYPEKMQKGKITRLTKEEAICIGEVIRKTGYIQPDNNLQEPTNNLYVTKLELKEFTKDIIKELMTSVIPLLQSKPQQLQIEQDYFCILGFANKKSIKLSFSERIELGKEATRLSLEMGKEKRYIDDEHYGRVGSYHISVLEKVFEI